MIGKDIRSIRQLARESGTSLRSAIINFNQYGTAYCRVMWFKNFKPANCECLFIFNNQFNWGLFKLNNVLSVPEFDKYRQELSTQYGRFVGIASDQYGARELATYINSITLLPESFDADYQKFVSSNQKTITPLIHKYGFSTEEGHIKRIYASTGDSKNFFVWAINAHYHIGISVNAIKRILWWNDNYKQLVKKLSKGTITAYTTYKDIIKLSGEITELRREKRINDVINIFNTTQKKILREMKLTKDDKKVFSSFYRLSESKKLNFVKKMSSIEEASEIMRQMRHITSTHFSWNKDSFMDYVDNVEGISYEKIYEKDDVILVKVKDFETVKQLAKTTNWCISKNKSYWNSYVEHVRNAEQYILFDFAQKEDALTSIVGFTCRYNKGITNAHDFINNNMMDNGGISEQSLLNSYVSHLKNNSGIYSFLSNHGIDINLVAKYEKPVYEWNKDSMYKYLYECVDKNNVRVLCDHDNMVAISVVDENVKYFLGDSYIDNINGEFYQMQHIIFMNFGMSQYDPNRILFAIIQRGCNGNEDACIFFKNEHCIDANISFEAKLSQFGLPYDTIRRIDDKYVRLRDAIQSFNTPEVMKGMKDTELFNEVLYNYIGESTMAAYIRQSIVNYVSFDYLNIFYDNGHKISEFISSAHVINILKDLANLYSSICIGHANRKKFLIDIPSQKQIEEFFNKETNNINEATKIGMFLAMDKIMSKEASDPQSNERLYRGMVSQFISSGAKGDAIDHFIDFILDNIDITKKSDCLSLVIGYTLARGGDRLKEKLESLKDKSDYLRERLEERTTSDEKTEDTKDPGELDGFEEEMDVAEEPMNELVAAPDFGGAFDEEDEPMEFVDEEAGDFAEAAF